MTRACPWFSRSQRLRSATTLADATGFAPRKPTNYNATMKRMNTRFSAILCLAAAIVALAVAGIAIGTNRFTSDWAADLVLARNSLLLSLAAAAVSVPLGTLLAVALGAASAQSASGTRLFHERLEKVEQGLMRHVGQTHHDAELE